MSDNETEGADICAPEALDVETIEWTQHPLASAGGSFAHAFRGKATFPNGYGMSIIGGSDLFHCDPSVPTYEVAITHAKTGMIVDPFRDTGNDIYAHCGLAELQDLIRRVRALPAPSEEAVAARKAEHVDLMEVGLKALKEHIKEVGLKALAEHLKGRGP